MLKNILLLCLLSPSAPAQKYFIEKDWVGMKLEYLSFADSLLVLDNGSSFSKKFSYDLKGRKLELIEHNLSSSSGQVFPYQLAKASEDTLVLKPLDEKAYNLIGKRKYLILYSASSMIDENFQFEKLSFTSTSCYGTCPVMKIEIYVSGKVYFQGEEHTDKYKGLYKGKLKAFELKDFKNLLKRSAIDKMTSRTDYLTDLPTYRLIVYYNGKKKDITTHTFPSYNKDLLDYLLNIFKNIKLRKYNKDYIFEL